MTETPAPRIRDYPAPRGYPLDPPPEYGWLRENQPVARVRLGDGREAWLVTRHADARLVYSDPRFSSDRRHPGFPVRLSAQSTYVNSPRLLVGMDGAEHAAARAALMPEFTGRRVAELRPRIQSIVDTYVDAMLAGDRPADLVTALAEPVSALVNCEHLGVPFADREVFLGMTLRLTGREAAESERAAASRDLMDYLAGLIEERRREPADDLLSRQLLRQRAAGAVDQPGLVSQAFLLLVSGYETTASMIPLGVVALLRHPAQLAALRADPGAMAQAVEELLRYGTPVEHITCRVALEDVAIGGVVVRAGDGVIIGGPAANRDASVFTDPDRLDIGRRQRGHLAFGYGPHQCLGQNLARAELQITYDTLLRRIPGLRLAVDFEALRFKPHSNFYGLREAPVTW